jgi:bifunctional non-homologous end joining protein LigD
MSLHKVPASNTSGRIRSPRTFATRQRSVRSGNDKLTHYIKPMLANIYEKPFDDLDWIFEVKWDGYRAIAEINKEEIKLYSRNGLSFLRLYPAVAEELKKIKEDVILDGEIVVLNKDNKPDFQKLQQYDNNPSLTILYYVFDCLHYNGKSLINLPLLERKKIAEKVLVKSKILKFSDHVLQSGVEFFSKVIQMDLEGMIAKRASSLYYPGKRTKDWLKIKNHNTQEAVIAGYTAPRGAREHFGALILGIYMDKKLKYIGHTGTGFTSATLKEVYETLKPLKRNSSPFDKKITVNSPVTWVEPLIVCAIKFTEITEEGILRHPVFLGLRIDKSAEETTTLDAQVKPRPPAARTNQKAAAAKKTSRKNEKKITVNGHTVTLSNQDKLYWPDDGITKGDLISYYNSISRYILPYLKDRPQSLRRNPNGIKDAGFFHKDAGHDTPAWVDTVSLPAESAKKNIEYILCNNKPTLLFLNNMGCIELNPWNSKIATLDYPDYMVMDLDPSDNNSFEQIIDTAQVVKEILDKAGAPAYCKTSGATGLHIYVPLKARYSYEEIRDFAEIIARLTQEQLPKTTTTERALNKRNGRIYLDYLQNKKGQTLASVYSARPKPGATVSTPLLWKEVKYGLHPSQFNILNIGKRLDKSGDLFSGVLREKINLKKCLRNLEL